MEKEKDYYEILHVARTASVREIKKAYRKLARLSHPDVNPGVGNDKFNKISEANEILSDPEKRAAYDQSIEAVLTDRPREVVQKMIRQIFQENLKGKED